MKSYDVVIVGAGVSGLFCCLALSKSKHRVLVIDVGLPLEQRLLKMSHIATSTTEHRFLGFGGLGISEGKYNYTNDFGGHLAEKIGSQSSLEYQYKVDEWLCRLGATECRSYQTHHPQFSTMAEQVGLKALFTTTRHLGTSLSIDIWRNIWHYLNSSPNIEFLFNSRISCVDHLNQRFNINLPNNNIINTKKLIMATGRSDLVQLNHLFERFPLKHSDTRLDLGFRIEMHHTQLNHIFQYAPEAKLQYCDDNFKATTYCMNPNGRVIAKYQHGLIMPEGQNCKEQGHTNNLNFSLFIPKWFNRRIDADDYLIQTINRINQNKGIILGQRLKDITDHFSQCEFDINPSLHNVHFDQLKNYVAAEYLTYTIKFLKQLEQLIQQPIDGNTILYALDSKLYAPMIACNQYFETNISGFFMIGDSSGVTSSLSQAAASGLYLGEHLA